MFHTNRLIKVIAVGVLSASALFASAANAELPPNGKTGGSLTILSNSAINSLNPAIQSGVATAVPGSQLFASLLLVDDKWQFHPYLADSWEKSADGKAYTFKLKQTVMFHDGKPVTSADVACSVLTVQENRPIGKPVYANLEGVETPGPHTVVIK